ncbi:MAG: hypothetical protein ABII93_01510 [Chrysiogenia bacterium]
MERFVLSVAASIIIAASSLLVKLAAQFPDPDKSLQAAAAALEVAHSGKLNRLLSFSLSVSTAFFPLLNTI